ncbi:MAG: YdiU family protein [Devosiaceae bacterium]
MPEPSPFPHFDTSYAQLPAGLHAPVMPYGASSPKLIKLNDALAETLGFDASKLEDQAGADIFSGNRLAPASQPLAMAYAGHQFGGFNPGLGDGRALLLGEVLGKDGKRYDIQLKGSGQTPYSRQGDGKAALGPVLREYVMSEAMAALGVPTTRALAAVTTGDPVLREGLLPGGIVTRVAASHLRVGTFEYAAFRGDRDMLSALVIYALERHYPEGLNANNRAHALLQSVIERQAKLIAHWMSIGFIHGVMNTDNCTISGETIDYGPCAFMDGYNPAQVYSSIDHQGRYAFSNQPPIAHWNMAVLAQALLSVLGPDEPEAVELAQETVDTFPDIFQAAFTKRMSLKLGLSRTQDGDGALIKDFLTLLAENEADFTNSFRALSSDGYDAGALAKFAGNDALTWHARWKARLAEEDTSATEQAHVMRAANPSIIPRNHRVEAMIAAGLEGDFAPFHGLVEALSDPYNEAPQDGEGAMLAHPPKAEEVVHATFCGT